MGRRKHLLRLGTGYHRPLYSLCPSALSFWWWVVGGGWVQPNCFSRVVSASGEERVIIFARRDIQVGEELTYDYRFQSRDEEQLQCNCGVAACRGS